MRPRSSVPAPNGLNTEAAEPSNSTSRHRDLLTDPILVERARSGDDAAFRLLVERHQQHAFQLACGLVRDEHDAREIVQEAFLRVHRGLRAYKGESSFYTWLYRIVSNLSIDLMRRPFRLRAELETVQDTLGEAADTLLPQLEGTDPIATLQRRELSEQLNAALDALPPYHRGVIVMRELEGMSYQEMAEAMGVSKGTIMSRLFHARQKLHRALAGLWLEHRGLEASEFGPE